MTNDKQMREAFEREAVKTGRFIFTRDGNDDEKYWNSPTQHAWEGFQLAWQSQQGQKVDVKALIAEYDAAREDEGWKHPHPILLMAKEIDALRKQSHQAQGEPKPALTIRVNGNSIETDTNTDVLIGLPNGTHHAYIDQSAIVRAEAPKGWTLVPSEPTTDMREAFHDANERWDEGEDGFEESPDCQWAAMIAAAPIPPSQNERQATDGKE